MEILLKFYCVSIFNKSGELEFAPIKGQGSIDIYKKDIYTKNFKVPKDWNISDTSDASLLYLVEVDFKKYEVVKLIEKLPFLTSLDKSKLEEIVKENGIILSYEPVIMINNLPIPDDIFIDKILWDFLVCSIEMDEYPLLIGPKGCGKTSTGHALAKAMGYNFYAMNCADLLKPESTLIGTTSANNGSTQFNEAQFMKHYTSEEKTIIYLQEMSRITQNGANSLTTITEQPYSYIYIKELSKTVYKGKNVVFMGDANFGAEYTGTNALDGAFFDRFTPFSVDYLSEEREIELLMLKVSNLNYDDAKKLVELANQIRAKGDDLPTGVSTRKLISMSKYLARGFSMGDVVNKIFKNLFKNGTQIENEEIKNIFNSMI